MSDFSNILGGLNIPSQIPLDVKSYSANELILSDLGDNFNLAYTYYKGLKVFCFEEQTTWEWKEVLSGQENTGLIEDDFVYPANIITFGVDYSNKTYNFFKVETPLVSTFVEEGDNIIITGGGTEINPYVFTGLSSPFNSTNNSYFPRNRDESQFGNIGEFAYDFSYAAIGANDDPYGQIGQIGIHPTEQYGALGELSYVFGYNSSSEAFGSFIAGHYNHSGTLSDLSSLFGRNNYSNSPHSLIAGAYNQAPFTALGYKTIFGQGNLVNGVASLTSGIALLNKSFGTTVLGQANLDYTNTSESVNNSTAPILIVGNGNITAPLDGLWTATSRSNALVLLKNGLLTLPSITNALITADVTGKAAISKEYLESVLPSISNGSETKLEPGANINITGLGTTDVPYVISSTNDDITQYTDEFAQQAVGSILENNDEIVFTYNNLTPSINANLSDTYTDALNLRFETVESLLNKNSYIFNIGTYEKTSTTNLRIDPGWNWKIDGQVYVNTITQNLTIPLCENGFNRIDLIVLNQLSVAELILGEETEGTAVSPTVPPNKLQAFLINVGDTDFEEEIPLLTNQVSQDVRTGVTETAPSEQAVIDYVSEQTTILDNSKADRSFITGASKTKITYNSEGIVIAGADLIESDIPTLGQAKITNLTTDLALKANLANPTFTGSVVIPDGVEADEAVNKGQLDAASVTSALVPLNEGGGIGYVINGRTAANYGNIGNFATDLSTSDSASSVRGATGLYSFASGYLTRASGSQSVALNGGTIASATASFASGGITTASNQEATAMGGYTTASGTRSMAVNSSTIASGNSSFSANESTEARSFCETAFGTLNTLYTPTSTSAFSATDRIFGIGNGTSGGSRSDALIILKNGLTTLPSVTNALIDAEATGKAVVTKEYFNANKNKLAQYTVATLPAGTQGDEAYVTDALAPTYMTTVVGGGSVVTPVFYNGTNWVAH